MRIKRFLLQVDAKVDNEPNIGEPNIGEPTDNPNSWPRSRPCSSVDHY